MAAGGKGHARRRENTAAVESNWDAIFGVRRVASGFSKSPESGSCPDTPATLQVYEDTEGAKLDAYFAANPEKWEEFWAAQPAVYFDTDSPPNNSVFIDNATGQVVTEDWWPEIDRNA